MRLLHILSQRPGLSGSGVFFNSLVREAASRKISQFAVVAGPDTTDVSEVTPLTADQFQLIAFPSDGAPFPVPGNSDVMPYPSTVFSQMSAVQLEQYLGSSRRVLAEVQQRFQPTVVHAHHLWLMTALAAEIFTEVPVVATAHNSELRQLIKAPHLAQRVKKGIRRVERIGVLTPRSVDETIQAFGVDRDRVVITGAGFNEHLFFPVSESRLNVARRLRRRFGIDLVDRSDPERVRWVCFAGRVSSPKGAGFLLEAFRRIRQDLPWHRLVLIGASGFGEDGRLLEKQLQAMGKSVLHLGAIPQEAVAMVFQCSDLFVLPSLFEGLSLVMLEAAACGCPCLISGLPTIRSWLPQEWISDASFRLLEPLQTTQADIPVKSDEERFVEEISCAIREMLASPPSTHQREHLARRLQPHSWSKVFERYLKLYDEAGSEFRVPGSV